MLKVAVERDVVRIGERFAVSFQRTLRLPESNQVFPLPPGLGLFPVLPVEPYQERVPAAWRDRGGVFIPMWQREALWLGFRAAEWKPNAVKVGVGGINVVSGEAWDEELHLEPQDYLICPDQPWLDGINAGEGLVRQFVAMPLGAGFTVEAQLTGREEIGGIQILVYEPKPGRFPDEPPPQATEELPMIAAMGELAVPMGEMGIAAGGTMRQKIYPDPYGVDTWDPQNPGELWVHIVNSAQYRAITSSDPPPSPVSTRTYTEYGLPWFDLYDESVGTVGASERLAKVKSIRDQEAAAGKERDAADAPLDVPEAQVRRLHHGRPAGQREHNPRRRRRR
jgi:hypothetical protein